MTSVGKVRLQDVSRQGVSRTPSHGRLFRRRPGRLSPNWHTASRLPALRRPIDNLVSRGGRAVNKAVNQTQDIPVTSERVNDMMSGMHTHTHSDQRMSMRMDLGLEFL